MSVLRIRDVKLSYHDVGRGSHVLVLLHGFPLSAEQPEAFNRALLDFLAESIWSGHDHARPE